MMSDYNKHPAHNLIKLVTEEMNKSIHNRNENLLGNVDTLKAQIKLLKMLHAVMIAEAMPARERGKMDIQRVSLSLKAQNQFCRTLMLADLLERSGEQMQNLSNEMKDSKV